MFALSVLFLFACVRELTDRGQFFVAIYSDIFSRMFTGVENARTNNGECVLWGRVLKNGWTLSLVHYIAGIRENNGDEIIEIRRVH